MKLQYLLEQPDPEYDKAVDLIIKDCQPFLEQINYKVKRLPLYRGLKQIKRDDRGKFEEGLMLKRKVRKDRQPKDMSKQDVSIMDQVFVNHFGYPYRTQALFTTGSYNIADNYGQVFLIFPIGQFNFLWDKESGDMFEGDLHDHITDLRHHNRAINRFKEKYQQLQQDLEKYKQRLEKTKSPEAKEDIGNYIEDVEAELQDTHENMTDYQERFEKTKKQAQQHIKKNLSQKNLPEAIRSGHEIMIATDYYYMIPEQRFVDGSIIKTGDQLLARLQKRLGK